MIHDHFVEEVDMVVYARQNISVVPRVGDELRFRENKFFRVTRVVFIYDEDRDRVNIGMVPS